MHNDVTYRHLPCTQWPESCSCLRRQPDWNCCTRRTVYYHWSPLTQSLERNDPQQSVGGCTCFLRKLIITRVIDFFFGFFCKNFLMTGWISVKLLVFFFKSRAAFNSHMKLTLFGWPLNYQGYKYVLIIRLKYGHSKITPTAIYQWCFFKTLTKLVVIFVKIT